MGILNVTPDSFFDGGKFLDTDVALERALQMVDEGAEFIDVGGQSTRPGAEIVGAAEEIRRVLPVIEKIAPEIAKRGARISIDTFNEDVAKEALGAGASIINDVSSSLGALAGEKGVGWVAMHMRGTPQTMMELTYYEDVVAETREFLLAKAEEGKQSGAEEIWIDPGIGFAKNTGQNLEILRRIDELTDCGYGVAVGVSRKRFLGEIAREASGESSSVENRLEASLSLAAYLALKGVSMIRVHDVKMTVEAVSLAKPGTLGFR